MGPFRGPFGAPKRPRNELLGLPGPTLGPARPRARPSWPPWARFGPPRAPKRAQSWANLGPKWGHVGPSWRRNLSLRSSEALRLSLDKKPLSSRPAWAPTGVNLGRFGFRLASSGERLGSDLLSPGVAGKVFFSRGETRRPWKKKHFRQGELRDEILLHFGSPSAFRALLGH